MRRQNLLYRTGGSLQVGDEQEFFAQAEKHSFKLLPLENPHWIETGSASLPSAS
jgi:hypothetical protein